MTTTVRLRACLRCKGAMSASSDVYGRYWRCAQCGCHVDASVPSTGRVAMPEAFKATSTVFKYDGLTEVFRGWRIRGVALPTKPNETYTRYDLECPYDGCRQRHHRVPYTYKGHHAYECSARHRIYVDLKALTWR